MITFEKSGSAAVKVTFSENQRYLNNGVITVPLNALALEFDGSGLAVFKKAANGDVLFECFPSDTNLATKEALEQFYISNMVGSTSGGGTGGGAVDSVNGKTGVVTLTAADVDAISIEDFDSFSVATQSAIDAKADKTEIPSLDGYATEEWVEDKNYATVSQIPSLDGYATTEDLASKADKATLDSFSASVETSISNLEKQDTAIGSEIASHEQAFNSYTAATDATLATKADKSEIPSLEGYATEAWVEGKGYATVSQIPSLDGYVTKAQADEDYQQKGSYLTEVPSEYVTDAELSAYTYDKATIDSKVAQGGTFDPTNYYDKAETDSLLEAKLDASAYTPSDFATKAELDTKVDNSAYTAYTAATEATLEGKANASDIPSLEGYATESWVNEQNYATVEDIPSLDSYLTKTSADTLYQPKGDYATEEQLAEKADASSVPTVQTGSSGTSSNYVYSDWYDSNVRHGVQAGTTYNVYDEHLRLGSVWWGGTGTVNYIQLPVANTKQSSGGTNVHDGLISSEQAFKLDALPSADQIATKTDISSKQDTLVSGTNIKTVNGESLLGSGNIDIQGGEDVPTFDFGNSDTCTAMTISNAVVGAIAKEISALGFQGLGIEAVITELSAPLSGRRSAYAFVSYMDEEGNPKNGKVTFNITSTGTTASIEPIEGGSGGTSYTAGDGITISGNEISVDKDSLGIPTQGSYGTGEKTYVYSYIDSLGNRIPASNKFSFVEYSGDLAMSHTAWGYTTNTYTVIPEVTETANGVMAHEDKVKLDALPSDAYSKAEIDSKIGDVETLLASI